MDIDAHNPLDGLVIESFSETEVESRGETNFKEMLADDNLTIQRVSIPAGEVEDAHYHDADTYIYHLQGEVEVTFTDVVGAEETKRLGQGDQLKIPKYVIHQPTAVSDEPVQTLAVRVGDDVETTYVDGETDR